MNNEKNENKKSDIEIGSLISYTSKPNNKLSINAIDVVNQKNSNTENNNNKNNKE